MRICFVDYILVPTKPGRSGLSDIVWDMASVLVDEGHEVHIVASYHTDRYPDSRVCVHNFPTPPIGYRNVVGQFWILSRVSVIIKRIRPDIVHAPEYVSTAVLATLGITSPLVLTVPGNIFKRIATKTNTYDWSLTPILMWAAKVSARRCACIIATSADMKYWWERTGCAPNKICLIPYGVNTSRFGVVYNPRAQLGIAEDQLLLLFVGRLSPEKGLPDLLSALAQIRPSEDLSNVHLEILGDGPQRAELEWLTIKLGLENIMKFRRWVDPKDLPLWYSAADALLLLSHAEGFARTIPEAMICGTPVIGSKISGTEDHIKDGINGFLYPVADIQGLASIIRNVIQNPNTLRAMRQETLNYAQQHLTWQRNVERIVKEVYLPLLAVNANLGAT